MSIEVAVLEPREVVITMEQTDLIKHTICQGATDAEMQLFFFDCQRRGVHPLDKLIHFTKRSNKYTPVTSIDLFRQRAQASGVFAGEDEPVYTYLPSGALDTCLYAVYRLVHGQRYKWTATARWDEYYPGDQLGFMWKKMKHVMLAKCAEALALRKAFPAELQGLYVKEEMDQAETAHLATTKTFAEKFPEQAQKIQEKLNAPATVLEPSTNDILRGMGEQDGAGTLMTKAESSAQQASDAATLPDDPAEPYCAKLRTCERSPSAINGVWSNIPEPLKQDCYTTYTEQLKSLSKKK